MVNHHAIPMMHKFNRSRIATMEYSKPTVKSVTHGPTFNKWAHMALVAPSVARGAFRLPDVNHHMKVDGSPTPRQRTHMILLYMAQSGADGHFDDSHFVVRQDGMFCTPNPIDAMASPRVCIGYHPTGSSSVFAVRDDRSGQHLHHAHYTVSVALAGYAPVDLTKIQVSAARVIVSAIVRKYDLHGHYGMDIVDPEMYKPSPAHEGVIQTIVSQLK